MSYVQRRRFLWIVFLVGLAVLGLTAALTDATTLVRLRFQDLAQQSTAIARLRCIASENRWERDELWTETRFGTCVRTSMAYPRSRSARKSTCSCGDSRTNRIACSAGRKGRFALHAMD